MQVVLLKPLKRRGNIGDIVNVANGFGRNYLIPQGFAHRATQEGIALFQERKAELEAKNDEALTIATKLSSELDNLDFIFIKQASYDGRLFGSVSAKDIAAALTEKGCQVNHADILIETPIKSIGIFEVLVSLHPEVRIKIIANVSRSLSEAADAMNAYNVKIATPITAEDEWSAVTAVETTEEETSTSK